MDLWIEIFAIVLGLVGIVGCIVPVIPGPPVSYVGMLILYIWGPDKILENITWNVMAWMLGVTIVVTILDYVVPIYFTKLTGGSKAASRGAMVGLIIGVVFFPPIGMIIGAFLGALIAEMLIEGKELKKSLKSAMGSFLGFLAGTGLKLMACGVMMYYIIAAAI